VAIVVSAFAGCSRSERVGKFASLIAEIVQLVSLHAKTSKS
jgi:hypothetical protein